MIVSARAFATMVVAGKGSDHLVVTRTPMCCLAAARGGFTEGIEGVPWCGLVGCVVRGFRIF